MREMPTRATINTAPATQATRAAVLRNRVRRYAAKAVARQGQQRVVPGRARALEELLQYRIEQDPAGHYQSERIEPVPGALPREVGGEHDAHGA
jgi:hypothetical protein